jgi:hypothetical protein
MPLCPTSFLLCPLPYAMTHLCSLYTIGPPLPHCDYHITLDSVYIDEVHSLYSLVLISQDFLFSCLNLCELAVGTSFVLPPSSPLLSPSSPHCQDLVTGLYGMSASPGDSTVPYPGHQVPPVSPWFPLVLICATLVACVVVCVHLSLHLFVGG